MRHADVTHFILASASAACAVAFVCYNNRGVCVLAVVIMPDREIKSPMWHPERETEEDVFDHTYKEKEGPKPPTIIVWRNVILMSLLHIGALYGVFLIPSASPLTWIWCKYHTLISF